jgi:hypothetical protein
MSVVRNFIIVVIIIIIIIISSSSTTALGGLWLPSQLSSSLLCPLLFLSSL